MHLKSIFQGKVSIKLILNLSLDQVSMKKICKDFQKIKDENYIKKFDERKFFSNDIEQWYGSAFNLTPSKKNEYKNSLSNLIGFVISKKHICTRYKYCSWKC